MALDKRAEKLAKIAVDYSTNIKSNDRFLIRTEPAFMDFAEHIGMLAEKKGAQVIYERIKLNEIKSLIERNNISELKSESIKTCKLAEWATACVRVDAETNPFYLKHVDPKKIGDYTRLVRKPFTDRITGDGKKFKGIKWLVLGYPCAAEAKKAGMTLNEYADLLYTSTNIDWNKTKKQMQKVKSVFDYAKDVHIIVPGQTDLHLSLKGRGGDVCAGNLNMPDGEVYYGPVENSTEGHIYFPYPSNRDGNDVTGIRLEYRRGKIVKFSAEKNQKFLESMLSLKGAKRIGELGIGCNYGVKKYINNLLFDEKIGGTIHLALGESYTNPLNNGGGKNKADIHWDLVCDLRKVNGLPGGEIYVDGKLVQRYGKWKF